MAGMLPGVEAARRRRIHQSSGHGNGVGSSPSFRRSSFSLFSTPSSASSFQRSSAHQVDQKLGQLAREAKERLDERLRAQRKSPIRRENEEVNEERIINRGTAEVSEGELRREVFGSKTKGGRTKTKRLMGWANKLGGGTGWKGWEDQDECAVCLDEFKLGDNLVNLRCAHRFHSTCLLPWLDTHAHCPCCRTSIFFS